MSDRNRYVFWSHADLVTALLQAEEEVRLRLDEIAAITEERDQYYEESRHSAATLGGILGVLRNQGYEAGEGGIERRVAGKPARSVEPNMFHQYSRSKSEAGFHFCVCGNQWLNLAGRCVMNGPDL